MGEGAEGGVSGQMIDDEGIPVPGVTALDHTADVGLEVQARALPALFERAALGTMWLILERNPGEGPEGPLGSEGAGSRPVALVEPDLPGLFRSWLRTVLLWDEVEGFVTTQASLLLLPAPSCGSPDGQGFGLEGTVGGVHDAGPRVREIKGVTLHGLLVSRSPSGWRGQVIFDV